MAVYDLEEQEKIDAIKAWWNRWGSAVIAAVIVAIAAYAGMQGWRYYKSKQANEAASAYEQLQNTAAEKDVKKTQSAAQAIIVKHASSPYAARAALLSARASFDGGDLDSAQKQLEWVVTNAKEAELKSLARMRLAGVLADLNKPADALAVLDQVTDAGFFSLAADLKGDILAAQGKSAEAKAAYKLSIEKAEADSRLRNLTQMKLDALGGAK